MKLEEAIAKGEASGLKLVGLYVARDVWDALMKESSPLADIRTRLGLTFTLEIVLNELLPNGHVAPKWEAPNINFLPLAMR